METGANASTWRSRPSEVRIFGDYRGAYGFGLRGKDHVTVERLGRRRWTPAAPSSGPQLGCTTQGRRIDREVGHRRFQRIESSEGFSEALVEKLPP
jgi:hypothetical protein